MTDDGSRVFQEAVGAAAAAPMETVAEVSEPRSSNVNTNAAYDEPEVITMDAVSVPDESHVSAEIKAMLGNLHTDPYSEDEVSVFWFVLDKIRLLYYLS